MRKKLKSSETHAKKILSSALFEGVGGGGSADRYLGQGPWLFTFQIIVFRQGMVLFYENI